MTELSRRTVLGTAGAIGAGAAVAPYTSASAAAAPPGRASGSAPEKSAQAVRAALERLLPEHAGQFAVTVQDGGRGGDRFRVTGVEGRISVSGSSALAALTGVHWYLKYECGAHISWAGSRLDLPKRLPAPTGELERSATVAHRFVFNDTHDGYTSPYADWARWERMIDILALHGCNEALVTVGMEAVYHRLLTGFGYSDTEARSWLPAPSHQPWWLLQNMSGYGGPLSTELIEQRAELGRRIADRMRELGISPVFPGYFGTVPDGFAERNPGAETVPQGDWNGLKRPDWLDPRSEVFAEVAAAHYRHLDELLGPVGRFKMDLLHEGGTPGDVPVPEAARAVERALRTAHPDAVWTILGWQENPRRDVIDALDKDLLLVVDGLSDLETVTDREEDWGGVPYAFGSIPNFGGRTTIGAKTHQWAERFAEWRDRAGSALVGTAYMPEAAERDPAAFELFSELAWREEPVDRAEWFEGYADLRYGGRDRQARRAFAVLRDTAYEIGSKDGRPHDSVFAARPDLTARSGTKYATHTPAFDPADFDAAFAALLGVRESLRRSDTYRYDLTDLGRQVLANRSWQLIGRLESAYGRKDLPAFRALSKLWLQLMALSDEMTGSHRAFLLGPWLDDARRSGTSAKERDHLEETARTLVTTWADRPTADDGSLANYANRDWHGLIGDFHLPQWKAYLDELEDALAAGREPEDFDWYAIEEPFRRERKEYPLRPPNDAYRTARRVHTVLSRAPYQGTVEVTAEPAQLPPGGHARVHADFRNMNGLRETGRVAFALEGPDAEPEDGDSLPSVPAAGSGRVSWKVSAPDEPLSEPLLALPYTLTAQYGPAGEKPVRTATKGSLYVAGPLGEGWRTYTSNAAVFGRLDDRFAVNGGGQDLWKATAEFGTAYRPGALADGGSARIRVDAQDATGGWARAGLIVRNSLAADGDSDPADAAGFANLSVTPENGVVLSYDSDGDGTLDTYEQLAGVAAPVTLRLAREGGTLTAACSTDDGGSWREVASVTVPELADALDVGLFMTATHGGSGARGTVEFSGWSVA